MKRRKFLTALGLGGVAVASGNTLLSGVEVEGQAKFPDDTNYPGYLKVILGTELVTLQIPAMDTYVDTKTATGLELRVVRITDWNGQDRIRIMCVQYKFVELVITDPNKLQEEGLTVLLEWDPLLNN